MSKDSVYAHTQTKDNYKRYRSITAKQWQVYYYLLSISKFDAQRVEDHRFIYKNEINISAASKFLNISRPTFYTAITNLCQSGLLRDYGYSYSIYARDYVEIHCNTLRYLLSLSKEKALNIDILRVYLYLKKMLRISTRGEERQFTKRNLIMLLGHDVTAKEHYKDMQNHIALLCYLQLIEVKVETRTDSNFGKYTVYHLQTVNETSDHPDMLVDLAAEMNGSAMPERIYKELSFTMPELIEK